MARRKLIIKKRIPASTILEVVISMIVIILVFGIAMMIFANVIQSSLSVKKIKAEAILRERLLHVEQNQIDPDGNINIGDFQIEQESQSYRDSSHLILVHLTAWDANRVKIAELKKIIFTQ